MATASTFTIDDAGITELFTSPKGDVYKYMESQARKITFLAKRYVGKRTRRLERSIGYRMYRGGEGIYFTVEASNRIALIHELGTRPHIITASNGRALKFKSHGRVVYARAVMHPGTSPNPYLETALREVIH